MNKRIFALLGLLLCIASTMHGAEQSKQTPTITTKKPLDFDAIFAASVVSVAPATVPARKKTHPKEAHDGNTSSDEDAELKQIRKEFIEPMRKLIGR